VNEQIAKGLRRRARQTTPTLKARGYAKVECVLSPKSQLRGRTNGEFFINHPHTTRGVYRTLKKLWKKEHRHG